MPSPLAPLSETVRSLAEGRTTSRALVEACLARIADPAGEGARAFMRVDADAARAAADAMDALRKAGAAPSPLAGLPIAIKDLADIAGQQTRAGSRALDDAPMAAADAPVVARLRQAGLVIIGRTNMTEFAYSGLGINPHYGTPAAPWRRAERRVPGGSSSGSAVAVADQMAHAALGTDTGGSCRIPAAFCGVTGWKPTAYRVPTSGVVPLSKTLDSIGPIARSVECCALLDAVMAGEPVAAPAPARTKGLRVLVPETLVLDDMEGEVATAFETALHRLSAAGVRIERAAMPLLTRLAELNAKGGFSAAESYAWHRALIARRGNVYDPRVLSRIMRGTEQTAADYVDLLERRVIAMRDFVEALAGYDALLMPTTPILPPRIDELATDEAYTRKNLLILRNTMMINTLDGCAISLPLGAPGEPPVGLMVAGLGGTDARTLAVSRAIESVVQANAS